MPNFPSAPQLMASRGMKVPVVFIGVALLVAAIMSARLAGPRSGISESAQKLDKNQQMEIQMKKKEVVWNPMLQHTPESIKNTDAQAPAHSKAAGEEVVVDPVLQHALKSISNTDSQASAHGKLGVSSEFPLGAAFKLHLESNSRTAGLVPASYPIDPGRYHAWEEEVNKSMENVQAIGYPGLLGKLRHVSFEEFLQEFIAQMGNVEKLLSEQNLLTHAHRCHLSYYRVCSGASANETRKSFMWMGSLFTELIDWDSADRPSSAPSSTLLKACWENTGRATTRDRCLFKLDGTAWDSEKDIVLSIEDVSYSGAELFKTVEGMLSGCEGHLPRAIVFATTFISNVAEYRLLHMEGYEDPPQTRLLKSCSNQYAKSVDANLHQPKVRLDGIILPHDLVDRGTFSCDRGIPQMQQEVLLTLPAEDQAFITGGQPGYQGGTCWAYFDHKMADLVSLKYANSLAAQGVVFSSKCYEFLFKQKGLMIELTSAEVCREYTVIPYVSNCETVHELSIRHTLKHGRRLENCAFNLQCPFPPYKSAKIYHDLIDHCKKRDLRVSESELELS